MSNPQKRKGTDWERKAAKLLEEIIPNSTWKRVAGSGAIGTTMHEPLLAGDIVGYVPALSREFRGEAKVGYGGAKQLTVKREWFEKIKEEAKGTSAIPVVLCKFSGARGNSKYFMAMDFETVGILFNQIQRLYESEISLIEKEEEIKKEIARLESRVRELEAKIYST